LHGGRVIAQTGEHRLTAELNTEQRRKLATLTAALPTETRSYELGRYQLEGPRCDLLVDDGSRTTTYVVYGVGRTPSEVREVRAIAEVAMFLRSLARSLLPSGELFDPERWLLPEVERESRSSCKFGLANDKMQQTAPASRSAAADLGVIRTPTKVLTHR